YLSSCCRRNRLRPLSAIYFAPCKKTVMWGHYALCFKVGVRGHEISPELSFSPRIGRAAALLLGLAVATSPMRGAWAQTPPEPAPAPPPRGQTPPPARTDNPPPPAETDIGKVSPGQVLIVTKQPVPSATTDRADAVAEKQQ